MVTYTQREPMWEFVHISGRVCIMGACLLRKVVRHFTFFFFGESSGYEHASDKWSM